MADNEFSDDFDGELQSQTPGAAKPGGAKNVYVPPGSRADPGMDFAPEAPEVEEQGVSIGGPKAKNILVVGVAAVVGLYFVYKMTFGAEKKEEKEAPQVVSEKTKAEKPPVSGDADENIGVVKAPELPKFSSIFNEEEPASESAPTINAPAAPESDDLFGGILLDENAKAEAPKIDKEEEPEKENLEIFRPEPVNVVANDLPSDAPNNEDSKRRQQEQDEEQRQRMLKDFYDQPLVSEYNGATPTNPVDASGNPMPEHTKSLQIAATDMGDANLVVGQGRMIEAVLESAINTDLPGYVRAVVSRDVYSETGRNILIPKGSRLVGLYSTQDLSNLLGFLDAKEMGSDKDRLAIAWTRIILPNGMDVNLEEKMFPGTDQLGRAGVHALVDRKYLELFSTSALLSVLTVGGAIIAEKISDEDTPQTSSTTTNTDGSITSTTNRSASDEAILSAVERMGSSVGGAINGAFGKGPTMIVGQGTRVRVFVRQDVVFPKGNLRYMN
ncbi:MAG: TrbI/VirB10 family protein [Rickettsiales bacterium]